MSWPPPFVLALSPPLLQAAGVIAGAAVAAVVTWALGKRNTSGSVTTSNASDLWEESRSIRTELRNALEQERKDRAADRVRWEADLGVERAERLRLEGALAAAERRNVELTDRVAVLESRLGERSD